MEGNGCGLFQINNSSYRIFTAVIVKMIDYYCKAVHSGISLITFRRNLLPTILKTSEDGLEVYSKKMVNTVTILFDYWI
jgi:hypothetical protein